MASIPEPLQNAARSADRRRTVAINYTAGCLREVNPGGKEETVIPRTKTNAGIIPQTGAQFPEHSLIRVLAILKPKWEYI